MHTLKYYWESILLATVCNYITIYAIYHDVASDPNYIV